MRIIFCNVAYLRYYDGREAGELKPKTGGRWVRENEDAHEKWNFLNMDDVCYGFVQGNGEQFHIEKLEGIDKWQDEADDVTVIWCASVSESKTVVVGWYEHAKAYRYLQTLFATSFQKVNAHLKLDVHPKQVQEPDLVSIIIGSLNLLTHRKMLFQP